MTARTLVGFALIAFIAGAAVAVGDNDSKSAEKIGGTQTAIVTRAVDGDTVKVMVSGKSDTVRLLGVDTPETHDPRKPVQCYGPEAAAFTSKTVMGKTVHLASEPSTGDVRDKYGRRLAYVTFSHRDLGAVLLRGGFARVYAFGNRHFKKRARYELLQARAQAAHVGRWGKC